MIINNQSQKLYKILLDSKYPLSAKELSTKLDTYPNTIYRLCVPLLEIGLIKKIDNYPNQFVAKPLDEGLSLFLINQNDWFTKKFFSNKTKKSSSNIDFSFVQGRDELMKLSATEIDNASKTVDVLRSGHEIPAEVMLAMMKAKDRGVKIRMLIQDYSKTNYDQITNWKKNGILVKQTSIRHLRLMVYDSFIAYFMSYKNEKSEKDMGMKVNYPPFATILSELFDQWWHTALEI
jgi:sugar-specific transcriptional regulator TrmB